MKVKIRKLFKLQPNDRLFKAGHEAELTEKEVKAIEKQLGKDFIEVVEENDLQKLTKPKLMKKLDDAEIEYKNNDTKDKLIELLEKE